MSAVPKTSPASLLLSAASYERIDREIAKYPAERRASAVIAALAIAQDEFGWVSQEVIEEVAAYLKMPPIAVFEVASFYAMYNLKPVGRHKITLCTNLPCALQGAVDAAVHLQQRLGVGFGETTADGAFTLKEGECMGACGDAPICLHNNHDMHTHLTPEKVDELLDELKWAC